MHEQSITEQDADKKWRNKSGKTGVPLRPENAFERSAYDSSKAADQAADMRSAAFGRRLQETMRDEGVSPFDKLNKYVDPNKNPRP